jgi:hypothetical protein
MNQERRPIPLGPRCWAVLVQHNAITIPEQQAVLPRGIRRQRSRPVRAGQSLRVPSAHERVRPEGGYRIFGQLHFHTGTRGTSWLLILFKRSTQVLMAAVIFRAQMI